MADVKPIFPLFIVYTLIDIIIKVTVADLITTFWQMLLPFVCEMLTPHMIHVMILY